MTGFDQALGFALDRLPLSPERRALAAQVLRYAVTGAFVTLIGVSVYWVAAARFGVATQVANGLAYLVSVAIGYFAHHAVSFSDQAGARSVGQSVRFAGVSLVSYLLNAFWVFVTTGWLRGPEWWPVPFMVFVTPAIVFVLNRRWVFA